MTLGPLLIDVAGPSLTPDEVDRLRHPQVGGVVLFSRNLESWAQLVELVSSIHALRDTRLLVGVDQEGGRAQPLREGFTRLPPLSCLTDSYRQNHTVGLRMAELAGWLMASELRAAGIDFSFAPVVDLGYAGSVVADRAFGRDAQIVTTLATAYMAGMHDAGITPVAKHFPGLGHAVTDPATGMLVDPRDYATLESHDMAPFRHLVENGLPAVLVANALYRQASPLPVTSSAFWIGGVLRRKLGFEGVVIADSPAPAEIRSESMLLDWVVNSIGAGCDLLRLTGQPFEVSPILDRLDIQANPAAQLRRVRMHGRHGPDRDHLHRSLRWREAVRLVQSIDPDPLLDMDL